MSFFINWYCKFAVVRSFYFNLLKIIYSLLLLGTFFKGWRGQKNAILIKELYGLNPLMPGGNKKIAHT